MPKHTLIYRQKFEAKRQQKIKSYNCPLTKSKLIQFFIRLDYTYYNYFSIHLVARLVLLTAKQTRYSNYMIVLHAACTRSVISSQTYEFTNTYYPKLRTGLHSSFLPHRIGHTTYNIYYSNETNADNKVPKIWVDCKNKKKINKIK